jgi:methylenetetrahydrofolate dehydrogenase (NADP+)/methenyltetrahydrofolate cyclohydrolase
MDSDIVVAAIGKPGFVWAEWIRPGTLIVDAGYHPGGMGDVEKEAFGKASTYTPVPGGVVPMTIATLMAQTVEAAKRRLANVEGFVHAPDPCGDQFLED